MKIKIIVTAVFFILNCVPLFASGSGKARWGYKGRIGPETWGKLSESYRHCSQGKNQSPVNINWAAELELDKIEFHYNETPVILINNGHTIQLKYSSGSYIILAGERFDLQQLHFHTLSEHKVNGKYFPMEMHLVHQDKNGRLAVVGVFFKLGRKHKTLQKLWDNLPTKNGQSKSGNSTISATALLPGSHSYYYYMGSLTTPPCSEGVRWLVLKQPIQIGKKQLGRFKKLFSANYRPVMPLNSRNIFSSK